MSWIVLLLSGALEAVWATALSKSEGFTQPLQTGVFAVGLVLSMAGLSYSLRTLPVGTSYAIWVGIGAVLTTAYAMVFDGEPAGALRVLLLAGIIGCVAGLKLTH
ncbi:multidrug efflux SMR transporter [Streptomyces sp. NBRC 110028]|uniref:DMT family transporter n=1 Tax=Streptomyces sp. NBRC 110028 TaxID=1621260 RepID=UPI0006E37897|nr:multidrug efflux SMR transporter [Streptomyces sp. NBRC 110028]